MSKLFSCLILMAVALVAGCQTDQARRQAYLQQHDSFYEQQIRNGQITRGMSKQEVRASWGDPDTKYSNNTARGIRTIWRYDRGAFSYQSVHFKENMVTGWSKLDDHGVWD